LRKPRASGAGPRTELGCSNNPHTLRFSENNLVMYFDPRTSTAEPEDRSFGGTVRIRCRISSTRSHLDAHAWRRQTHSLRGSRRVGTRHPQPRHLLLEANGLATERLHSPERSLSGYVRWRMTRLTSKLKKASAAQQAVAAVGRATSWLEPPPLVAICHLNVC
jgi:hypothetical protein